MDWYYHEPGQGRVGPFPADEIRNRYRDRRIQMDTLVWREGVREWQPLDRFADELDLLSVKPDASSPPPLPPGPLPGVGAVAPASPGYREPSGHYAPPGYRAPPAYARAPEPERKRMSGCLIAVIVAAALAVPMIAILAAIAIPAYNDYTVRAKLTVAVDTRAKVIQAQVDAAQQRLGRCPNDAAEAGVADSANLDFGTVDRSCAFRITVRGVNSKVDGKTVEFAAPTAPGNPWNCTGGDLPPRYRRPECRATDGPENP